MTVRLTQEDLHDDRLKIQLQAQLDEAFPEAGTITDVICATRTNLIVKVLTARGSFGFKRWTGAQAYDGFEQGCAERDKVMNELAHQYKLPHWSKVVHDIKLHYKEYFPKNASVSLTAWLPEEWRAFDSPTDSVAKSILENGGQFFNDFGECLAFGIATGYKDWGPNNFMVMDNPQPRASMIDMDWSFNCGKSRPNEYSRALQHLHIGQLGNLLDDYMHCMNHGFDAMRHRIEAHPQTVQLSFTAEGTKFHNLLIDDSERKLAFATVRKIFVTPERGPYSA